MPNPDNIIIVQEAIHTGMDRKQQGMANAFDRVNHFFLFESMSKFGFSSRFIRWIKACISSPWIAPLVNGRPTKFFQSTRGIRQGCLVADSLSKKLQQQQDIRELKGLKIARGVRAVNHAQFINDTILLGGASTIIAERFKIVLSTFLKALNGKINATKAKAYG